MARVNWNENFKPKVVYFLDDLMKEKAGSKKGGSFGLTNTDEKDSNRFDRRGGLRFESRFESGNLRKVIQV